MVTPLASLHNKKGTYNNMELTSHQFRGSQVHFKWLKLNVYLMSGNHQHSSNNDIAQANCRLYSSFNAFSYTLKNFTEANAIYAGRKTELNLF